MVAAALGKCGTDCSDLGLQRVMHDPVLEREVLVLYAWDQIALDTRSSAPAVRVAEPLQGRQ